MMKNLHFLLLAPVILWILLTWKFFSVYSHLLLMLLLLEFFMLVTFFLFLVFQTVFFSNSEALMMFFTLAVCEACLGLGALILLTRKLGSEHLNLI